MHHPASSIARRAWRKPRPIFSRACARRGPRVHCITNAVAQNFTANVLLAAGCVPSMTLSPEEIGPFVAGAQALLVNLGTFDSERREATEIAVETAARAQTAMGARSGVRRPRAAARCFRARTDRPPAGSRPAQSCRIFRTCGRCAIARCGDGLSRAPTGSWSGFRARPISSPTASASRRSPTDIR